MKRERFLALLLSLAIILFVFARDRGLDDLFQTAIRTLAALDAHILATAIAWLSIALCIALLFLLYVTIAWMVTKTHLNEISSAHPEFFTGQGKDRLWEQVKRDREKSKTNV